ncbi:AAA family ATPase, putative [Penicillium digitatum]|uniref:AAA family ATPase, putative n=1 Tax=Penicillium digitatum TaxID=36651 RepID=A0A7T6XF91_PENDI|nr:AAA family ATPase, putative [Penicillium digitatum]
MECYDIKIGEKVSITRAEGPLEDIDLVTLEDCSDLEKIAKHGSISESDRSHWEWALDEKLLRCGCLTTGLTFELELKGQARSFRVVNIHSQNPRSSHTLFQFTEVSKISLGPVTERKEEKSSGIAVQSTGLGGLSRQIEDINESLSDFNIDLRKPMMPSFYENSRGILLYGPKGTGKTSLLEQIEKAGWKQTFRVGMSILGRNINEGEVKLRNIFQEAARSKPSVIIIDQLEFIAPKRTSIESQSLASVLCENLDAIRNTSIIVVAATRHPNQVDDALRTPHRLGTEIEIHVPTAQDRAEILHAIRGPVSAAAGLTDELVELLAEKTHGYVGADLFALLQLVCRKARQRQLLEQNSIAKSATPIDPYSWHQGGSSDDESAISLEIQEADILLSLQEIRPTAMREVFLETPKVRWSDIGGQHDIKKRLQQAVERPLKYPQRMRRLNVNSKKGVLLYGPPGCSKTLTVKALATEAGLNFLAVKGAEILSMYVGESERSLREIFRKARAARPSIIFFDEIDAIAARRSSSSGGVNVLTTLLNEMDGIEELRNVLVIAATNKPDVLDPALMRPGRLDNILYIGPPDFEARREILRIWADKSVVNPEVDLDNLASLTEGYSGAEIVSICETAGDAALDEEEETQQEQDVQWKHFEYALGQVRRQITETVIQDGSHYIYELGKLNFPSSQQIVVEKLTKNVTENHIREIFGGFGEIEYLDLPINKAFMTNRGTAYILYYDPADAEAAIAHMHEAQLDGAILNVSIVLPRRKFSRSPPPASIRGNGGRSRYGRGSFAGQSSPPRRHGGGRPAERHDIYRPQTASRSRSPVRSRSYSSRSRSPPPHRGSPRTDSRHRRRRSPSYSSYGYSSRSRSPNRNRGHNRN